MTGKSDQLFVCCAIVTSETDRPIIFASLGQSTGLQNEVPSDSIFCPHSNASRDLSADSFVRGGSGEVNGVGRAPALRRESRRLDHLHGNVDSLSIHVQANIDFILDVLVLHPIAA